MERLGYYKRPKWGLGDFTDQELFDGIKRFQKDNGLEIDGVMKPGGETEQALDQNLGDLTSTSKTTDNGETELAFNRSGRPSENQCEEMFERETLICDDVWRTLGARAGASCQQTAMNRYAACLRGIPMHLLPPLSLPQYLQDKFDF